MNTRDNCATTCANSPSLCILNLNFTNSFLVKKLFFVVLLFLAIHVSAQRGKDGVGNISAGGTIVNEYTDLTADASAGTATISVGNSNLNLNGYFPVTGALSAGDLILIIQMQGVTMNIDDAPIGMGFDFTWPSSDTDWGAILNYNNCGNYEFAEVMSVPSGTSIELRCGLQFDYTASGHVQIVRVQRYSDLTVTAAGQITAPAWDGTTGGIVAIEVENNATINGSIDVSSVGFRGGSLVGDNVTSAGNGQWGGPMADDGAEKGEGVGGYHTEYDAVSSRYMKGAPANAGGGACGENAGGGGGGNGGNPAGWLDGRGVPDPAYNDAWDQESPSMAGVFRQGGGRGGYTFSDAAGDPYNDPVPSFPVWGGDSRRSLAAGLGGRPLDYSSGRLYFGGGGGAGDQNNGDGGEGGRGAGLVYVMCYGNVTGSGSIIANGQDGFSTDDSGGGFSYQGNDGAGGGGAGGTVVVNAYGTVSINQIVANGGDGGDNLLYYWLPPMLDAYGPGGGGGGGHIAISAGAPTRIANGGAYGISETDAFDASGNLFPPNGATSGNTGNTNATVTNWDITSAGTTICAGQTANLTASITGTAPGGTVIVWYDSDAGGTLLQTGANYSPSPAVTTTYYVGTCPGWYLIPVTVTVSAGGDAGTNGNIILCSTDAPTDLFNQLGGSPDPGGTWSGPSSLGGGDAGTIDPGSDLSGTYTYTISIGGGCPDVSADVDVTINAAPDAGLPGTHDFCSSDTPANLFSDLNGTPDSGGSWSGPSGLGGADLGTFDPSSNTAGSYTYTVSVSGCTDATADVDVTIETAPDAGSPGALNICATAASTDLINELGTPDGGGSWSGPSVLGGGDLGTFDPSSNSAGTYTYTVTGTNCPADMENVVVAITAAPDAGLPGTHDFCSTDGTADLFSDLNGTPDNGGTWSGPSVLGGGDLGTFDPASDLPGTYTYTVSAVGCLDATADIVVAIETAPDAGTAGTHDFCSTDGTANLFADLNGTPDNGGTWSGPSGLGGGDLGTFDPASDLAGTYTYTVNGTVCSAAMADVVVTIETAPNAGIAGSVDLCSSDAPTDLFNELGGTPDTGGSWSGPSLLSGGDLGTFDPALNAPGTYSYTVTGTVCAAVLTDVVVTVNTVVIDSTNYIITDASCGASDGSITGISVSGGTTPYGYDWSGTSTPSADYSGAAAGSYTLTVTDAQGCTATTGVYNINSLGGPTLDDTNIIITDENCGQGNGGITGITTSGGTTPYTFDWSGTGTASEDYTGIGAGSYTLSVTDDNGCVAVLGPYVVTNIPGPTIDSTGVTITDANCGASDGSITGITVSGGTSPYVYAWNGTTTNGADTTATTAGIYTLTVTDGAGCVATSGPYVINDLGAPTANFLYSVNPAEVGESVIFTDNSSADVISWNWDFGGLGTDNAQNSSFAFNAAGTYTVCLEVTNSVPCTAQYCTDIVVEETTEYEIWLPNVFSPNGDGENDVLMVYGQGIDQLDFYIYDRWGELVYEGHDPAQGWDGMYNGAEMDPATFVYYAEATYTNGQVESLHGNFTLVR